MIRTRACVATGRASSSTSPVHLIIPIIHPLTQACSEVAAMCVGYSCLGKNKRKKDANVRRFSS